MSCANEEQVGLNVPVKFGDYSSNGSRDIQQRSRRMRRFWPFFLTSIIANRKSSVTSYPVRLIRMSVCNACANFGDSRLKPAEASFSALFKHR